MRFETKKAKMLEFLDLCKLTGVLPSKDNKSLFETFYINADVESKTLWVTVKHKTGAVFTIVKVKDVDVIQGGKYPVTNADEFYKIVKLFKGNYLTFAFDNIHMQISDGTKKAEIRIEHIEEGDIIEPTEQNFIKTEDDFYISQAKNHKLGTAFDIKADDLKSVIDDSDYTKLRTFPVKATPESILISVTNQNNNGKISLENNIQPSDFRGNSVAGIYSFGFHNIFKNLSGIVHITMDQNYPMIVDCVSSDFEFHAVMVPDPGQKALEIAPQENTSKEPVNTKEKSTVQQAIEDSEKRNKEKVSVNDVLNETENNEKRLI